MKKGISPVAVILLSVSMLVCFTSFLPVPGSSTRTKAQCANLGGQPQPVIFHTVATSAEGTTYFGTVEVTGAIEASGTYEMPTESHGMALHCILYLDFPEGDLTIRMNCNMVTFDGTWQILSGTGAYASTKGNGTLIMPDDIQEILTGDIRL